MNQRVAAVIPARNEENFIGRTLAALFGQHTRPNRVIVVNDGSTDRTAEVASAAGAEVVDMPDRGYNVHGMPVLAGVINRGLARLQERGYGSEDDYVLILGADHILPPEYITTVLDAMAEDRRLALCSGMIEGERSIVPRGSGRVVRADFWQSIGCRYPENYGFETYLVLKAQPQDRRAQATRSRVGTPPYKGLWHRGPFALATCRGTCLCPKTGHWVRAGPLGRISRRMRRREWPPALVEQRLDTQGRSGLGR